MSARSSMPRSWLVVVVAIACLGGCARDTDLDGVANYLDNCPDRFNRDQADPDADGLGSKCDPEPNARKLDQDGDKWVNAIENALGSDALDADSEPEHMAIHPSVLYTNIPIVNACNDGKDNDGDGKVDKQDDGCDMPDLFPRPDRELPDGGLDAFSSNALIDDAGVTIRMAGPVAIARGDPEDTNGDGTADRIPIEIIAMQLRNVDGQIELVEDPGNVSGGSIVGNDGDGGVSFFPATSSLDVSSLLVYAGEDIKPRKDPGMKNEQVLCLPPVAYPQNCHSSIPEHYCYETNEAGHCPEWPEDQCEIDLAIQGNPNWLPEGRQYGTPVGAPGNSVDLVATVTAEAPRKIRFFLQDVSSEPGVAINYGDESGATPDLRIIQTAVVNPPAIFDAPVGQTITTTNEVNAAAVTVTSYDWGAWGKTRACCLDDDGACEATSSLVSIPQDDLPPGGNHIADSWQAAHANEAATWDADGFPGNMERNGDGFTFYEEYRGTMNGTSGRFTSHDRHNPEHKDLFLYDRDNLHLRSTFAQSYTLSTFILAHYLDADPAALMNGTGSSTAGRRHVTWKSEFSHTDDQHALDVVDTNLGGPASNWGIATADPAGAAIGPPATARQIQIDAYRVELDIRNAINGQGGNHTGAEAAAYATLRRAQVSATTAHEMGHGTDVNHHSQHAAVENPFCGAYGVVYCGLVPCLMRYDYDLVDRPDATHPALYGVRTAANSPPGTAKFSFSNYADRDLSDTTPVINVFGTMDNDCMGQIDVKDD